MGPTDHIASTLLHEVHPAKSASAIFKDKVLYKPLRLRPTSPDPNSQDARTQRRLQRLRKEAKLKRRKKNGVLSAKEKRDSGIYEVSNDAKKYEIYEPLHRMWVCYMWEILGIVEGTAASVTAQGAGSKLASADFHGAEITVVRSTCVGMVGLSGIVLKDTKFTFQVITKKNDIKTIPKRHTIFKLTIPQSQQTEHPIDDVEANLAVPHKQLPELVFELHGSQLEARATDRATKKFKQRYIPGL